jgi:hypothetical protein
MPTGYKKLVGATIIDAEDVYEPIRSGDQRQLDAGYDKGNGNDTSDLFTSITQGTALGYNFGYSNSAGVDFTNLYAAKNSVARYPTPLPWDRTTAPTVTVYRQPSRPTLQSYIAVSISIHAEGFVAITQTVSPYNSNPSAPVVTHYYTSGNAKLWTDVAVADSCPYEVRFDVVSGPGPTFAQGGSLGSWLPLNTNPFVYTLGTQLTYAHSQVEGTKTLDSQLRISVRRAEYPVSNTANAILTHDFNLIVEPTIYQDVGWNNVWVALNNAATNYYVPEGQINIYKAAVRFTLTTTGSYLIETAAWKNNDAINWTTVKSGQWMRSGFNINDFEALFSATNGSFDGDDVGITLDSYLQLGGVARTLIVAHQVSDSTVNGTYSDSMGIRATIRQISTKGWAGLPDNFAENIMTLVPSVTIAPPKVPDWPAFPWVGNFNDLENWTRNTDDPSGGASCFVLIRFYPDGVSQVWADDGQLLSQGRWAPAGDNPAYYDVIVSGSGIYSNPLANYGNINGPYVDVVLTAVNYSNSQAHGTYEDYTTFNVTVRRKAYTSHTASGGGQSTSRITVAPMPLLINPPSSYDNWAGTFTNSASVSFGPPPNNIVTPILIPSNISNVVNVPRLVAAPTQVGFGSAVDFKSNVDGTILVTLKKTYHNSSGQSIFGEPISSTSYQIVSGNVNDYEIRVVYISGPGPTYTDWYSWSNFGNNGALGAGLPYGFNAGSTNDTSSITRTDSFRFEVRHKTYNAHIATKNITVVTTANLTAYSGGSGGGGGGGGGGTEPVNEV